MSRKKLNNKKERNIQTASDNYTVKNIVITLLIVVALFAIFYCITVLVLDNKEKEQETTEYTYEKSKIIVSQLLSKPEERYYVLATLTNGEENMKNIYESYYYEYLMTEDTVLYYIDLNDSMNSKFVSDTNNITENLDKITLSQDTFFVIENGKIKENYSGYSSIVQYLKTQNQ